LLILFEKDFSLRNVNSEFVKNRLAKCQEKRKEENSNVSAQSLRVIHGLFGDEIISILVSIL
jgi:hypothetical protein